MEKFFDSYRWLSLDVRETFTVLGERSVTLFYIRDRVYVSVSFLNEPGDS